MKLTKIRFALIALVVGAVAVPSAIADGWFSEMGDAKAVSLGELLRAPDDYVDLEVKVKVYFDALGESYNPYYTRFAEDSYGNFAAWPINARLYDKRDFKRSYPLFFVQRFNEKLWEEVQEIERLETVEVVCIVREVFRGQPWIEVVGVDTIGEGLTKNDVQHVIAGDAYFRSGRYADAVRHYKRVDKSDVNGEIRAELWRKLGDAQYKAGEFDDAEDSYREALETARGSEVLKSNAAAAAAAYQRARDVKRGKAVDGPEPQVADESVPVVEKATNDVDDIISVLESSPKPIEELAASAGEESTDKPEEAQPAEETPVEETPVEETPEQPEAAPEVVEEGPGEEAPVPPEDVVEEPVEGAEASAAEEGVKETVPEEVVEEPVEKTVDEPVEEVVEEPVKETVEEPVEEVVDEQPVEETVEEPMDEPADEETAEESVEPVEEVVEEPVKETVEEPVDEGAEASATEEPVEEVVEEVEEIDMNEEGEYAPIPEEDLVEETAETEPSAGEETAEEGVEEVSEETVEETVEEETVEEVVEEPVEKTVDEPVEEVVEEPVKETVEEVVEEPVEDVVEGMDAPVPADEVVEEEVVVEDEVDETPSEVAPLDVDPVDEDPRVVRVGDKSLRIPRLPFFGCEGVTLEDQRAVLEEILRNPET